MSHFPQIERLVPADVPPTAMIAQIIRPVGAQVLVPPAIAGPQWLREHLDAGIADASDALECV